MGYFSNGEEGIIYQQEYCGRCINLKHDEDTDTWGCPIWDLHVRYNYDQYGDKPENKTVKTILDLFIPLDGVFNEECKMYIEDDNPFNENPFE